MIVKDIDEIMFEMLFFNTEMARNRITESHNKIIVEKGNLYNGIYDDVCVISNMICDLALKNQIGKYYSFNFSSKALKVNKVTIGVFYIERGVTTSMGFSKGELKITVNVSKVLLGLPKEEVYEFIHDKVESYLIHELTHAKSDSEEGETIIPDWYRIASRYIIGHKKNISDIAYLFFFSLYVTENHEIQAFASQVTYMVEMQIKKEIMRGVMNRNERIEFINNAIDENFFMKTYKQVYNEYLNTLQRTENDDRVKEILKSYNINCNNRYYKKMVQRIQYGCERFFKKVERGKNYLFSEYVEK